MEVLVGVQARDGALHVQVADEDVDRIKAELEQSVVDGERRIIWVKHKDGRTLGIPVDKIAFVEFCERSGGRTVGFSAAS